MLFFCLWVLHKQLKKLNQPQTFPCWLTFLIISHEKWHLNLNSANLFNSAAAVSLTSACKPCVYECSCAKTIYKIQPFQLVSAQTNWDTNQWWIYNTVTNLTAALENTLQDRKNTEVQKFCNAHKHNRSGRLLHNRNISRDMDDNCSCLNVKGLPKGQALHNHLPTHTHSHTKEPVWPLPIFLDSVNLCILRDVDFKYPILSYQFPSISEISNLR